MAENTLQFKITIKDAEPSIWRRLHIPSDYNFFQFHMAIQGAFGWENCHLFQFTENDIMDVESIGIPSTEDDRPVHDARSMLVTSIFKKAKDRYSYVYDFGDDWLHEILLEKVIKRPIYTPFCIEAKNACPPEDVGGIHAYKQMLKTYAGRDKEEINSFNMWLGLQAGDTWDAAYCDRRQINSRLSLLGYWSYEATARFMPEGWYKPIS